MIILLQRKNAPIEAWEDMRIPASSGPPRRKGITVDELAEMLVKAEAAGIYRVATDIGELFKITVEQHDSYQVKVEPTTPDIV